MRATLLPLEAQRPFPSRKPSSLSFVSIGQIQVRDAVLTFVRLTLLVIVLHIVKRGEDCVCENVVALCARIIDRLVSIDREDVRFAVLVEFPLISRLTTA